MLSKPQSILLYVWTLNIVTDSPNTNQVQQRRKLRVSWYKLFPRRNSLLPPWGFLSSSLSLTHSFFFFLWLSKTVNSVVTFSPTGTVFRYSVHPCSPPWNVRRAKGLLGISVVWSRAISVPFSTHQSPWNWAGGHGWECLRRSIKYSWKYIPANGRYSDFNYWWPNWQWMSPGHTQSCWALHAELCLSLLRADPTLRWRQISVSH